jgi:beta-1,4-mannooligosaccharide/beta-1,4-mannosyl-N-acetylglucosamine phosphorylase
VTTELCEILWVPFKNLLRGRPMSVERFPNNPIFTREDLPEIPPYIVDATSVFNPGAIKFRGKYLLMLRVQTRGRETFLVMAESDDGVNFAPRAEVVRFTGIEHVTEKIYHIYDPRLTQIGDWVYVMFAADMDDGCRLGVARTSDFCEFEFLGFGAKKDIRNGVIFPEQFSGKYLRLDRPNTAEVEGGPPSGDEICLSESHDLVEWRRLGSVLKGRPHYWDERIGSGPPPIKTREGWLHVYHGIATHFGSTNIYQAGVVLLDLDDPGKVVARGRNNILEPREPYELTGQVPNVVFLGGMIVEAYDDEGYAKADAGVFLYYGAADTSVALARTTVGYLLTACHD